MEWKSNPQAELIIDLAGRITHGKPALREIWIQNLLAFLRVHYPEEVITQDSIKGALKAGDSLSEGKDVLGTSAQRRKFRELFPT